LLWPRCRAILHPRGKRGRGNKETRISMSEKGKLSLVATPIGNMGDITRRAVETLSAADVVAAEDTRRAGKLLSVLGVKKRMVSYHSFNERSAVSRIISMVAEEGLNVAVVSDAGTPALSDPGFLLVREALAAGLEPEIVPGVSALAFAVTASGLPVDQFSFLGFPPRKSGARARLLERVREEGRTAFFYESPHRIARFLAETAEIVGPDAEVAVIREATKLHEEIIRGTAAETAETAAGRKWRGEIVVGVKPA